MASEWRPKYNPWLIAITVTLATFMEVLDTSIANVALPHIAGNLSAGVDESTWVLTSYLVANAIVLPLSAFFSSLIGRKNYYMLSVLLFTISSLLSGFAPNLTWLVIFRIMQGFGGGGLQPSEQSILADTFPKEKIGMAMALYGFAVVTAPILGPTLGGWITDNFSWRWIFFINIPVGILSLYMTNKVVEDPPHQERRDLKSLHIDYIGLSALVLGIGALQFMLDKGERLDWFGSHLIATLAVTAGVSLLFLFVWEYRKKDPIIEVRLLGDRNFFIANVLMFMLGVVLFGSTVLLPLFLQTLMGYPATTAGLVLSPGGLVTMATMPIVGILTSRVQARWLVAFGLTVVGLSLIHMSHFNLDIDYRTALLARMFQAAGLGFLFIPINSVAYSFVPHEKHNQASGLINLSRNLGGSVGIAIMTTLLARFSQIQQNILSGHLSTTDPAFQNALQRSAQNLFGHGLPMASAKAAAQHLIYGELLRQSSMRAYILNFRYLGIACFATLPFVFFMKKSAPQKGPAPVH
jgi:MFS transporter, DHA2 family, multidrug resistance protein